MLRQAISRALVDRFGDFVAINLDSETFAVFNAAHSEVGELKIVEDGGEIIVYVGHITHGHFGSYEPSLTVEQHEEVIAESLIQFLVGLFDDKYFLFSSEGGGGWARYDMIKEEDMKSPRTRWFKWSGPYNRLV